LVGIVFVIVFLGIMSEGNAIIGRNGIAPVYQHFQELRRIFPEWPERILRAPSLFWFSAGDGMTAALEGIGLLGALALVANVCPRVSLFVCWCCLLSFVSAWGIFTSSIDDKLMLETAILCIPFAPAGVRPGLGRKSPPSPLAVLAMRLFLLRIMLESGVIKAARGDPHWQDLSAMKAMFETSPFPTFLGYLDYHLPRAWHAAEMALTFAAELLAPLIAVVGGGIGMIAALLIWATFQIGIELTTSFGWLNFTSIGLGFLLLDDRLLSKLVARRGDDVNRTAGGTGIGRNLRSWCLALFLGGQFLASCYFFSLSLNRKTLTGIPKLSARPIDFVLRDFWSSNAYIPYESFPEARDEVEFQGSNDNGRTWRTFEFKYKPQAPGRICPYVAPWLPRFESALQIAVHLPNSLVIPRVAAHLLLRDRAVMALFREDPFPDLPPKIIRMPVYRLRFTSLGTFRSTGRFWEKDYVGDFARPVILSERGIPIE
jgi:hypothetical protein